MRAASSATRFLYSIIQKLLLNMMYSIPQKMLHLNDASQRHATVFFICSLLSQKNAEDLSWPCNILLNDQDNFYLNVGINARNCYILDKKNLQMHSEIFNILYTWLSDVDSQEHGPFFSNEIIYMKAVRISYVAQFLTNKD